jgi:hypothetical protein
MQWRRLVGSTMVACASVIPAACSEQPGSARVDTTGASSRVTPAPATPAPTLAPTTTQPALPDELAAWWPAVEASQWRSTGDDRFEVWVCHVAAGATNAIYGGLALRLPLTPAGLASLLNGQVTSYFTQISHGLYRPVFVAGGEYTMAIDDKPSACIDAALDGAGTDARAVLAVADAEHGADQVGGFARGGEPCPDEPPCPPSVSRRFAYVGASDFHPEWGEAPPMDLVEHEIGHTLGWGHSAVTADLDYQSAIDVMSNSAAARELLATRRDGSDTLAINRLQAGWLPLEDVWRAPSDGGTVQLSPSTGDAGTRLALLACCGGSLISVELLTADGFNDHLPADGVAVHKITVQSDAIVDITPLFGSPPFAALLQPGESLAVDGWTISVGVGVGVGWTVTVSPVRPSP